MTMFTEDVDDGLTFEAKVPWGQLRSPATICPVWLQSSSMACTKIKRKNHNHLIDKNNHTDDLIIWVSNIYYNISISFSVSLIAS